MTADMTSIPQFIFVFSVVLVFVVYDLPWISHHTYSPYVYCCLFPIAKWDGVTRRLDWILFFLFFFFFLT
ncbi:hypothetical protein BP00DRAFT_31722 [Aspergillus indologenus CBS 114.80]|uniref:Uncharacterized protein n=1 Tax=Aspergillus indologenus CBS 114.80 TaxID=1450541 RepID=A0A2V5ITB0_9EURO|nr:hypothetical protein BP00DRAFT_31722 [Aspergillus indologenus CBS 114.80]